MPKSVLAVRSVSEGLVVGVDVANDRNVAFDASLTGHHRPVKSLGVENGEWPN